MTIERLCADTWYAACLLLEEPFAKPTTRRECQGLIFSMLWEIGQLEAEVSHRYSREAQVFSVLLKRGPMESMGWGESLESALLAAIVRFWKKAKAAGLLPPAKDESEERNP